jgi:hypothetical protein
VTERTSTFLDTADGLRGDQSAGGRSVEILPSTIVQRITKHRAPQPAGSLNHVAKRPWNDSEKNSHKSLVFVKTGAIIIAVACSTVHYEVFPVPGLTGSGEFCGAPRSNAAPST